MVVLFVVVMMVMLFVVVMMVVFVVGMVWAGQVVEGRGRDGRKKVGWRWRWRWRC